MSVETIHSSDRIEDPNLAYEMGHAEIPYRNEIIARNMRLASTAEAVEAKGSGHRHLALLRQRVAESNEISLANANAVAEAARKRAES